MSDNPYRPPEESTRVVGINSGTRDDLHSVALYQKGILVCILLYMGVMAGQFLLPVVLRLILLIPIIVIGLTSTALVFLLAMKVYNVLIGIVLGILIFVPPIGLIVLLMVNGKATTILRKNGIRVGFLGADLSQI